MVLIKLSHGLFAKIDDKDFEKVSQFEWFAYRIAGMGQSGKTYLYGFKPGRKVKKEGEKYPSGKQKYQRVWLYNFLMEPSEGMIVDHINGDPLDNRRSNLRIITQKQNVLNRGKRVNGKTSKFLGVSKNVEKKKFIASIKILGKSLYLGSYSNEEDAAKAYNEAAIKYFGEFARLNEI